jgi:hypothetical protein
MCIWIEKREEKMRRIITSKPNWIESIVAVAVVVLEVTIVAVLIVIMYVPHVVLIR